MYKQVGNYPLYAR